MQYAWMELRQYFRRMGLFTPQDWLIYCSWVGLVFSLALVSGGFIGLGLWHGVSFPTEAFFVPIGALIFTLAISVDTIGHLTIYREEIKKGEALVHYLIIFAGIASCLLLVAAHWSQALMIPAAVLTILSFAYSWIDEAIHWRRYLTQKSDPVEMWSHFFILFGHAIMMWGWWVWYFTEYAGAKSTMDALTGGPA